jgi:hypothetical protein
MRAAGLDDMCELPSLRVEPVDQLLQRGVELIEKEERGHADGGRKDVVRRLGHVHVIVRIDRLVLAELSAESDVGQVGDDLVAVHVERGPGTGLEDVDDEVAAVSVEVGEDHVARGDDGLRHRLLHDAELVIGERGGALQEDEGADELRVLAKAADRVVLDGALRLCAVQRVVRDLNVAEGVFFRSHARERAIAGPGTV